MKSVTHVLSRLAREENGTEVMEYALILGLIVVATITAVALVGTKVLARWNSVSGSSL